MERQDGLERKINSAYVQFQQETEQRGVSERDQMLKDLAAGYDAYMELSSNLAEGSKVQTNMVMECIDLLTPCSFTMT